MSPQRIQRMRTKGWRMPDGAVYVGRPTKWGNPYRVGSMLVLTGTKAGQKLTKSKKRAAAGVCPCCNRTFQNVSRHVAGQHPEFVESNLGAGQL